MKLKELKYLLKKRKKKILNISETKNSDAVSRLIALKVEESVRPCSNTSSREIN